MQMTIREILALVGAVIILAIFVDGLWRKRRYQAMQKKLKQAQVETNSISEKTILGPSIVNDAQERELIEEARMDSEVQCSVPESAVIDAVQTEIIEPVLCPLPQFTATPLETLSDIQEPEIIEPVLCPKPQVLKITQNRILEKNFLNK